jgi:hypothetical protein
MVKNARVKDQQRPWIIDVAFLAVGQSVRDHI